ncbi:cupredoxin domain-containing protein [Candidatus Woesearchaeota archaeon]|nr:cupredoxin domain-containing protein [Candidatus Woesearchaeota archaeon]
MVVKNDVSCRQSGVGIYFSLSHPILISSLFILTFILAGCGKPEVQGNVVADGITVGGVDGVTDSVTGGVTEGVIKGVTDGVPDGGADTAPGAVSSGEIKEFSIIAKNWEFVPGTIAVNHGDRVVLRVKSVDVQHGFRIAEYGINEGLEPNKEVRIEFVADKKGTFPFFCSVPCGKGHKDMRGELVVS